MSIDTELARLTNAKAAIKAAIEGKGVTVPDGTLLDGMAAMIEAIEAGSEDFTIDGRPVAWGIITPAETITSEITLLVSAGSPWLGVDAMPTYARTRTTSGFIVRLPKTQEPSYATLIIGSAGASFWGLSGNGIGGSVYYNKSSESSVAVMSRSLLILNNGNLKLTPSKSYPLVAGDSYLWFAVQTVMPEDIK